jgi:glutamine---fructose-6-phosphate transaminase (isomerizing)
VRGQHTWSEIESQPSVWQSALERAAAAVPAVAKSHRRAGHDALTFIGCGSTFYLSQAAAALASEVLGIPARGLPSSEIFLFPRQTLPRGGAPGLIAVSRSGETSETIKAVAEFRKHFQTPVLTVGNYSESVLARQCEERIIVPEGQEVSIAQTRSFNTMVIALQVLLNAWAGGAPYLAGVERLPGLASMLLDKQGAAMRDLGSSKDFDTYVFLGSGPLYGIACEGMLKMKEMSLSHSEAFHYMEFRHGPKSIVNKRTLILALLSDSAREEELRVLREMRQLGASVLLVADGAPADAPADVLVDLGAGLPEGARLPACLLPLQMVAFHRAIAQGLDPDNPTNLSAVVIL